MGDLHPFPWASDGRPDPHEYRRIVNTSATAINLHVALDEACGRIIQAEGAEGCSFIANFLPMGEWADKRFGCSRRGRLHCHGGGFGRHPGNQAYAILFHHLLLCNILPHGQQKWIAFQMGDKKLGDTLEAVLSLSRPGHPMRDLAMAHATAIAEAVEAIENIMGWALVTISWPQPEPSSLDIAIMLT